MIQQIQTFFLTHSYLIGLVSFAFGLLALPIVIRIAKAKGLVVRPNKRMSHTGEVPNIGGLGIYFSVMLSYLLFDYDQIAHNQFFMIGVALIMAIGFIDDILVLTPLAKLAGETLAGIALIGFGDLRLTHLHGIFGIGEIRAIYIPCKSACVLVFKIKIIIGVVKHYGISLIPFGIILGHILIRELIRLTFRRFSYSTDLNAASGLPCSAVPG